MIDVEIILCALNLLLLIPAAVLFAQVLLALPARAPRQIPSVRRPTVAVVIPAHNEALLIASTLGSIAPQLAKGDRLIVVADNCTDDTAKIAAAAGAEVIERTDLERRGKGYALDFGVRNLRANPPEIVLIVDADCIVEPDTIERLARECLETGRPVQGMYLMHAQEGAGPATRIAEFAWLMKRVRAIGYQRIGLPCQLMGTGMAFPWSTISNAELATGHIVEDMKLGIDLVRNGAPTEFCPEAKVTSYFPGSAQGMWDQRTRWEHGHIGMLLGTAPRLFIEAIFRANVNLMAIALDVAVPPLSLFVLLVVAVFAGSTAFFVVSELALPMWLSIASLVLLSAAVLLSWVRYGREVIPLHDLLHAPFYALRKIPLYLKFLLRRQSEWVRSKRDHE